MAKHKAFTVAYQRESLFLWSA